MTKYRLKKDTPNFEAGSIFVIHSDEGNIFPQASDFIYDPRGNYYDSVGNIKHFDEWFEEVKEEPKWVRKQIKQVLFDDNQLTDNESVWVKMRFLKDFYFEKTDIRGIKHYKAGYELEKVLFKEEREILLPQTIYYINQLVRDGYIEIQDSPNIVWEDEKCD